MWPDWKGQIKYRPKVRHSLLWEYDNIAKLDLLLIWSDTE
jgi:hypothetical protein